VLGAMFPVLEDIVETPRMSVDTSRVERREQVYTECPSHKSCLYVQRTQRTFLGIKAQDMMHDGQNPGARLCAIFGYPFEDNESKQSLNLVPQIKTTCSQVRKFYISGRMRLLVYLRMSFLVDVTLAELENVKFTISMSFGLYIVQEF
jgi:hypothetical protein